jgi:hypothetical protein
MKPLTPRLQATICLCAFCRNGRVVAAHRHTLTLGAAGVAIETPIRYCVVERLRALATRVVA